MPRGAQPAAKRSGGDSNGGREKTGQPSPQCRAGKQEGFTATGVSDVDSFDDQTIVAYTDLGELVVRGHGLHINRLNMETGELTLTGEVDSLTYTEGRRENGFLSRLFK